MSTEYERGIHDGIRIAWIDRDATEEVNANETQLMLIQLALDHAMEDAEFRQIMLSRYNKLLEVSD